LQKYIIEITEKETYVKRKQNKAEDGQRKERAVSWMRGTVCIDDVV